MKKLLILVILAAMLCSISIPASAASDTYQLSDLGLEISIPTKYRVFTRDLPENSPVFSELGTTKADMLVLFYAESIYLDALTPAIDEEIVITMTPNDVSDMSSIIDGLLTLTAERIKDKFLEMGREVSQYDIYQSGSVKYIRLYYTETATDIHSLQYFTVIGYKAINITMHSYKGSLTAQQEATIKNVVDSVRFQKASSGTVSGSDTSKPNDAGTNETTAHPNLDLNTWQDDNQDYTMLIVLGAVFAALGVVVVVIVLRKKKKNEYEEMMEFCAAPSQPQKPEEKKILCRKCGHMLPEDSAFCHFCGTKIEKES